MDLLQISKDLKLSGSDSMVPTKDLVITYRDYMNVVQGSCWINRIDSYVVDEEEVKFVVSSYIVGEKKLFMLTYDEGQITISYDGKIKDEIIVKCNEIAIQLNALLLSKVDYQYPKSKIIAAQKRLAQKAKESDIEYQSESFGGNTMWLSIRSSLDRAKEFYHLEGQEKPWSEALENMHACEGMFMYEFRGWTFIAGQKTDTLFGCQIKGEKAIEKCHFDMLLEWGKTFNDVQLFMHYDRFMYFNAFYRVLNGEMVYGEYETESYTKKYGKIPKNLIDLPNNNANTVALEWSYEPDYLRYQKELENAKAWIVNIKEEP